MWQEGSELPPRRATSKRDVALRELENLLLANSDRETFLAQSKALARVGGERPEDTAPFSFSRSNDTNEMMKKTRDEEGRRKRRERERKRAALEEERPDCTLLDQTAI